jgi:hypothetical protein
VTGTEGVSCGGGHSQPVRAVARLYWPTGRFSPTTACAVDLAEAVRDSIEDERVPVEVWPIGRPPENPMHWGQWRKAPDCGRCNDRGRFTEGSTEGHCTCKRGRRMSELWYAEKHGYGHPDEADPEPPDYDDGAPF